MNEFGTIAGIAIAFVAQYFFDKWQKKRAAKKEIIERPKILDAQANIRKEISDYILKIQAYAQCSRVALFEYSNGTYTHSNISLQFVECSYEATDETTKPITSIFKRMPIAPYLKILMDINESKTGWTRLTDHEEDKEINKINKYWSVSTIYNFKITDIVWDGVVSVCWISGEVDLDEQDIEIIKGFVFRINFLMSKLVKQEKNKL